MPSGLPGGGVGHYDPLAYAMNGRCTGPLSNGKPRRS